MNTIFGFTVNSYRSGRCKDWISSTCKYKLHEGSDDFELMHIQQNDSLSPWYSCKQDFLCFRTYARCCLNPQGVSGGLGVKINQRTLHCIGEIYGRFRTVWIWLPVWGKKIILHLCLWLNINIRLFLFLKNQDIFLFWLSDKTTMSSNNRVQKIFLNIFLSNRATQK